MFVIEQIPNVVGALTGLASLWLSWRSKQGKPPPWRPRDRTVRISAGEHTYEGPLETEEQLTVVMRLLGDVEAPQPPARPAT